MYRAEFVNVRQHHFDALSLGLEAPIARQRIEPDQAAARPVQPVHLERQLGVGLALQPVGNQQHDRALPHNLLKVCSEVPMRVPPAQSSTVDEQLARASSGSRARSARVTLLSLVPNRNTETRLRASVMACRKCRNSRVYSLIEPDISSSATIGAGLSIRPNLWISMMSPPVRKDPRRVRRMSSRKPRASG